jgi:hypothetical protein
LQAIIAIHILLYFTDGLPLPRILFSIACHIVYLQNFSHTWPFISLMSLQFMASCILVIADHFLWFFYFTAVTHQARKSTMGRRGEFRGPTFGDMATFFGICVWLAPLFLFLSLSANDNALPTNSGMPMSLDLSLRTLCDSSPPRHARHSDENIAYHRSSKRAAGANIPLPLPACALQLFLVAQACTERGHYRTAIPDSQSANVALAYDGYVE